MIFSTLHYGALFGFLQTTSAIAFPAPTGAFGTTLQTIEFVDNKRADPLAPTSQPRKLMVSLFTPVVPATCNPVLVPYLDKQTAAFEDEKFSAYGLPPGLFGALELSVCSSTPKKTPRPSKPLKNKYPLIVFSPGLGTTRLFYSALAQRIASEGYIVVSVDHPYDVDIVTFPDNSTAVGVDIADEDLPSALNTRVKDISFVINQLAKPSFAKANFQAVPGLTCEGGLDVSQVGVMGHSFGGAAAAEALLYDSRLKAGINLDGTFFGKVVEKGLKQPFLIFAHDGKNRTTDYSWEAIWPKLTGWKKELMIKGAAHYSFSDLPLLIKVLGIADGLPAEAGELLGALDGARAAEIVGGVVSQYFGKFLEKKKSAFFDGNSGQFPEVSSS